MGYKLAFAVLETFPCAGLAGLLSLLLARVTGEVASVLESLPQFAIVFLECPGNAKPHRAGLASDAAASDLYADIRLLVHLYRLERFHSNGALVFDGEVVFHGATVDGDFAGAAGRQAHAGNRSLAAACS